MITEDIEHSTEAIDLKVCVFLVLSEYQSKLPIFGTIHLAKLARFMRVMMVLTAQL